MAKVARVQVTPELLAQCMVEFPEAIEAALHLPTGSVRKAAMSEDWRWLTLECEHDGLKDAPEGEMPTATPTHERDADGTIRFLHWGQDC